MNRKQLINIVKSIKDIRNNATDEQALSAVYIYPEWNAEKEYAVGDRVQYDGTLYKCLTSHTAQETWTPVDAPSLWVRISDPSEEWSEWVQPTGSTDAYNLGDKVSYADRHWVSDIDANVWKPDVYGWTEYKEDRQ